MYYGICHLSIVPVRSAAADTEEMLTQLLYGDHFKVLEKRKHWSRIRNGFDKTEGWIHNLQYTALTEEQYNNIQQGNSPSYTSDLISFVSPGNNILIPIPLGASVAHTDVLSHTFEGTADSPSGDKTQLVTSALLYLNAPYLWGGKTPFGIDCAGFTQMVYKRIGFSLLRTATAQATQGTALSFIEESEAGDLAFFDNNEGVINHVGIIMKNNYIIHVNGAVRVDRLDHTGIFNTDLNNYTHQLRVIKKIL